MSSTDHLSELESLRSQVADLTRELAERDRSAQDLRKQSELLRTLVSGTATEHPLSMAGTVLDVTEHKRAEEALRLSEERFRAVFENTAMGIAVGSHTKGTGIDQVNPAFAAMLGYTPEELCHLGMKGLTFPDDIPASKELVTQLVEGTRSHGTMEKRYVKKDGSLVWAHTTVSSIFDKHGRYLSSIALIQDITERKRADMALRASEERYRTLYDDTPTMYFTLSTDSMVRSVNRFGAEQLGYKVEELVGHSVLAVFHEEDKETVAASLSECLTTPETTQRWELRKVRKNGDIIWVRETVRVGQSSTGETVVLVTCEDITERYQAEKLIKEAERRYRTIFEQAGAGVAQIDSHTGRFVQVNHRYCEIMGLTEAELLATTFMAITHPDDLQGDLDNMARLLRGEIRTFSMEKRLVRKDGRILWINLNVAPLWESGEQATYHIAIVDDITERKRAEEALRASEERYRSLVDNAPIGIFVSEAGRFVYVNREMQRILMAPSAEQLLGNPVLDRVAPEFHPLHEMAQDLSNTIMDNGQPVPSLDEQYMRLDGSRVEVSVTAIPTSLSGTKMMQVLVLDITERKRAEEALRESEQSIRALHEATAASGLSFDERVQAVLEVGCRRFKLPIGMRTQVVSNKLELIQVWAPGTDFTVGMVVPLENTYCNTTLQETEPVCFEHAGVSAWQDHPGYKALGFESYIGTKLIGRDQVYGTVCFTGPNPLPASFSQADKDFVQLMARWISGEMDRRMAEQALKYSEERYRALYDDTPTMYFTLAVDGTVRSVNRFGAEQLGYRVEELIGHSVLGIFHEQDKETVAASLSECLTTPETTRHWEFRKIRKDGTVIWVRETACVGQSSTGETVVLVTCEDITEHRRMEEALRKSEQYNRILFENSPIGLVLCQLDGTIVDCNERYTHILGRSRCDILGKTYWELTSKKYDEQGQVVMETVCRTGRFGPYEKEYVHADGHLVPVRLFGALIEKDGELFMNCCVEDITDRKWAEEALRQRERDLQAALQERERISQDLHDGILQSLFAVGLTLETTKSMMTPRTRKSSGPPLDQAIKQLNLIMREIRNFIAGLGSDLLDGKDLTTALKQMMASLTKNQATNVRLAVDARAAKALSTEQSLHLVRVIQEAVSNCIQHSCASETRVSLKLLKQGVRLSVRDNGCGFNQTDAKRNGHGLRNMASRAQKIGGKFSILSKVNDGTRIVLDVPRETADVSR